MSTRTLRAEPSGSRTVPSRVAIMSRSFSSIPVAICPPQVRREAVGELYPARRQPGAPSPANSTPASGSLAPFYTSRYQLCIAGRIWDSWKTTACRSWPRPPRTGDLYPPSSLAQRLQPQPTERFSILPQPRRRRLPLSTASPKISLATPMGCRKCQGLLSAARPRTASRKPDCRMARLCSSCSSCCRGWRRRGAVYRVCDQGK